MAEQKWSAAIRPELHPAAQELVNIYESTPGSTGPGCCPEALAAVLNVLSLMIQRADDGPSRHSRKLDGLAALLRGEQS